MKDLGPILLYLTTEDLNYLQHFKPFLKGRKVSYVTEIPQSISQVELYAKSKGFRYIITTSGVVLNKVIDSKKHQSLDSWNGSIFERNGISYLFLNPLAQLFSVPYGKFITERFTSKFVTPDNWERTPAFSFEIGNPSNIDRWFNFFKSKAIVIASDIETKSFEDVEGEYQTVIRCVSYSGLFLVDGKAEIYTIVIPICEAPADQWMYWLAWMRKFNDLDITKVYQNGPYDTGHMLAYGSPVRNYFFDTQSMLHSLYSELPKDLAFIGAFCIHNIFYWKDMASEGGLAKLFEYNARDSWATLASFIYLISNMPKWAINNHLIKFPLFAPCGYCNLEGVKVNGEARARLFAEYKASYETTIARLEHWFGKGFNPKSPQQVVKLIQFYGNFDITGSSEAEVRKFALRHPLFGRFATEILRARETSKIISTYIKPADYSTAAKASKKKSYLLKSGRLLYTSNPDGTDTARLASKESIFWTGSQVQNQPEEVKEYWEADSGWELFEIDNEKSESHCTANLSGDANLLAALSSGREFHSENAHRFFGIPYEQIWDDVLKKCLDKEVRQLGKRINHGATYNMTWVMLLVVMGEKAVDDAKKLLGLNPLLTRRKVCEYLISLYDKTYPTVKKDFYDYIKMCIHLKRMLVSELGWTRYCFGDPSKSKPALNSYVAHVPQNLSVQIINEGFKRVFWEIQVKNSRDFRLKAQIHDSILGQNKIGKRALVFEAAKLCIRPTPVKDCHGITRIMTIPVAIKIGPNWGNMEVVEQPQ